MANRFDRPIQKDYNMDFYVPKEFIPNFEGWDQVLGQMEQEKAIADQLGSLAPKYIQQDKDAATSFIEGNRAAIDELTNLYMNENVSTARKKQADLLRNHSTYHYLLT